MLFSSGIAFQLIPGARLIYGQTKRELHSNSRLALERVVLMLRRIESHEEEFKVAAG